MICSPLKFNKLGTKRLGEFFEAFLVEEINAELAFDTVIKEYVDSFWNKHFNKIKRMLYITRLLPLVVQSLLLIIPHESTFIINCILSLLLLLYELASLYKLGRKEHFKTWLNVADMMGHSAGLIWVSFILLLNS